MTMNPRPTSVTTNWTRTEEDNLLVDRWVEETKRMESDRVQLLLLGATPMNQQESNVVAMAQEMSQRQLFTDRPGC